jgi:preprotein translocase subunit YajC
MMEDGSLAGQGLTVMQTFTYFVAAPVLLFVLISFFAYITAKETRKESKKSINPLTHIE